MASCLLQRSKVVRQIALAAFACSTAWTAQAQTASSPFSDLITEPGGAGLGAVMRLEKSPYIGGGMRRDLLPLYLYEGEHVSVQANRIGIKFVPNTEQRYDVFFRRRLEGFPEAVSYTHLTLPTTPYV